MLFLNIDFVVYIWTQDSFFKLFLHQHLTWCQQLHLNKRFLIVFSDCLFINIGLDLTAKLWPSPLEAGQLSFSRMPSCEEWCASLGCICLLWFSLFWRNRKYWGIIFQLLYLFSSGRAWTSMQDCFHWRLLPQTERLSLPAVMNYTLAGAAVTHSIQKIRVNPALGKLFFRQMLSQTAAKRRQLVDS